MNTPTQDAQSLVPQDLSRLVESVMHVYQGNHDHLPELLNHCGTLVLKMGRRLSTSQLLVIGGLLAVGALLVIRQVTDDDGEEGNTPNGKSKAATGRKNNDDDKPMGPRSGEHRASSTDKP